MLYAAGLYLPAAVSENECQHSFLKISFPGALVVFSCGRHCSACWATLSPLLNVYRSQFHFLFLSWSKTGSWLLHNSFIGYFVQPACQHAANRLHLLIKVCKLSIILCVIVEDSDAWSTFHIHIHIQRCLSCIHVSTEYSQYAISTTVVTRGSAIAEEPRDALRQLKYYGRFLTELLTRSSVNPQEPCEHVVSWNRVQCCTNVRRIACENVCNRWMTFKVIQGHCRCHNLIGHILFPISLPL